MDEVRYRPCKKHSWSINKNRVTARINNKILGLHSYIMDSEGEFVVDHIDRNPLNNRRSNLRVCTQRDLFEKYGIQFMED